MPPGQTAQKIEAAGVKTPGVVATDPERARLYFRSRRPRLPIGADPELATHRAYGLPHMIVPPELWDAAERAAARELGLSASPAGGAFEQLGRFDGYDVTPADQADFERHRAQLTGQFLIDRAGIVRRVTVECARGGLDAVDRLPPDEDVLAAARAP